MADVFISYKREELTWAQFIAAGLEAEGFSVFYDMSEAGISVGETWDRRLEHELSVARTVISLWSPRSVASDNVRDEARRADKRGILIPVMIDPCDPPLGLGALQMVDLTGWRGDRSHAHWRVLIDRGVAVKLNRPGRPPGSNFAPIPPPPAFSPPPPAFSPPPPAAYQPPPVYRPAAPANPGSTEARNWRWAALGIGGLLVVVLISVIANQPKNQATTTTATTESSASADSSMAPPIDTAPAATPAAYDLNQLDSNVRDAAENARAAEVSGNTAAANARAAASRAIAGGLVVPTNGEGTSTYSGDYTGDSFAGQFSNGVKSGYGVYKYTPNKANVSGSLRYEGQYLNDKMDGYGIFYWRSGERYAGNGHENVNSGYGVDHLADGRRFEGNFSNDKKNGYGVLWTADGRVQQAGLWTNGTLTTPLGPQNQ